MRRLGICGAIGSGKSHVAALLARERGYTYISADAVFKELVLPTKLYQETLTKHMQPCGIVPFVDGVYQAAEMAQYMFGVDQEPYLPRLQKINTLNAPFMLLALQARMTGDCLVEMALLPDFRHVDGLHLDATIIVCDGTEAEAAVARDSHRDPDVTRRIHKYQVWRLMAVDADMTMPMIMSRHPDGTYATNAEILGVFDEINRNHSRRHDGR